PCCWPTASRCSRCRTYSAMPTSVPPATVTTPSATNSTVPPPTRWPRFSASDDSDGRSHPVAAATDPDSAVTSSRSSVEQRHHPWAEQQPLATDRTGTDPAPLHCPLLPRKSWAHVTVHGVARTSGGRQG